MTWWQRLRHRWRLEGELDRELRYHLERLTADLIAGGLSPAAARQRAQEEFGGIETVKDACRDVRGTRLAHDLGFDLRAAGRLLLHERGFSLLAVLALSLGIGLSTTLFTVVDALCLRTFPLDGVERLVEISAVQPSGARQGLSLSDWDRITSNPAPLEAAAAYTSRPAAVRDAASAAERVTVAYVSGSLFAALRLQPASGRGLAIEDDDPGAAAVVVISDRVRRSLVTVTAGTAGAVGRSLRIDGREATIVGVMPGGFAFPDRADAWMPLSAIALPPGAPALTGLGRLAADTTVEQVSAALGARLTTAGSAAARARLVVTALDDRYRNPVTNPAWLAFLTAALLVAIIAASNVATLLLARGVRRQREMAIRLALGATRTRIVRQLLVETALLAVVGGAGAVLVGVLGLRLFAAAIPDGGLPYWTSLTLSPRVFVVLAAACLGTVLVAGLAPALTLARAGGRTGLQTGGPRMTPAGSAHRWTWVFLTTQLGLTVLLLSGVGLTTTSLLARQQGPALDASRLLTFAVSLPPAIYPDDAARRRYFEQLTTGLTAPGHAVAAAIATALPGGASGSRRVVSGAQPLDSDPTVRVASVGADYFRTIGLDLVSGREAARTDGVAEAVVNSRFAELFLQEGALDQTIRLASGAPGTAAIETLTVVGVAATLGPPGADSPPMVYLPITGDQLAQVVVVAATIGEASDFAPTAREAARQIDADVPLARTMSLADANWNARWNARVSQGVVTTIAFVALILATLGLTALTSQSVSQSRRELGVRVALGARPAQIVWLVLRRVLLQLAVGLTFGALGAWAWGRVFGPADSLTAPANLAAVAAIVLVVTLSAALWPARRAARVDPLIALRQE